MTGRLKVWNAVSGAWEYVSAPLLRYVPLATPINVVNGATTTSDVAQTHTADIGSPVPTNAVAVAVMAISRHSAVTAAARLNIYDYGGSGIRIQSIAGKVGNHYETAAFNHWVVPGGTNNRQIDYAVTIGAAGTFTTIITIVGYWTYEPEARAYPPDAVYGYGTVFPAASAGDRFFRTDLLLEFVYTGARWVCTCLHDYTILGIGNLTATTTDQNRTGPPSLPPGCTDIWLVSAGAGYHVAAGTALSASHKWEGKITVLGITGEAVGTLYSKTIQSGASAVWRRDSDEALGMLWSSGLSLAPPSCNISLAATKTGTPGNFYWYPHFTYRFVAT